jgi:RNA 2',3'-cyclic 3'-phosphodiesterase
VFPPAEVQRAAYTVGESLRHDRDGVSWVKRENLHYTLRFIGDVGDDALRRVSEAATLIAAHHQTFDAELGGIGAFPKPEKARVIWLGMTAGERALMDLARELEAELRRRGFERAERPFSAHLTLGRARVPGRDWTESLASAHVALSMPRFKVDRISVVESVLSPKGSAYTVRSEGLLGG